MIQLPSHVARAKPIPCRGYKMRLLLWIKGCEQSHCNTWGLKMNKFLVFRKTGASISSTTHRPWVEPKIVCEVLSLRQKYWWYMITPRVEQYSPWIDPWTIGMTVGELHQQIEGNRLLCQHWTVILLAINNLGGPSPIKLKVIKSSFILSHVY